MAVPTFKVIMLDVPLTVRIEFTFKIEILLEATFADPMLAVTRFAEMIFARVLTVRVVMLAPALTLRLTTLSVTTLAERILAVRMFELTELLRVLTVR